MNTVCGRITFCRTAFAGGQFDSHFATLTAAWRVYNARLCDITCNHTHRITHTLLAERYPRLHTPHTARLRFGCLALHAARILHAATHARFGYAFYPPGLRLDTRVTRLGLPHGYHTTGIYHAVACLRLRYTLPYTHLPAHRRTLHVVWLVYVPLPLPSQHIHLYRLLPGLPHLPRLVYIPHVGAVTRAHTPHVAAAGSVYTPLVPHVAPRLQRLRRLYAFNARYLLHRCARIYTATQLHHHAAHTLHMPLGCAGWRYPPPTHPPSCVALTPTATRFGCVAHTYAALFQVVCLTWLRTL